MRAIRACAAAAAILMSGAIAVASPGDDLGQDEASCKLFPNPDFQADCSACIAKPGKHYHWHTHVCHAVKSPPPPPPAVITGVVTCARFLTDKKLAACETCIADGRHYLGKSGKCQDPDPDKMDPKPQLDRAACNASNLSASDRAACQACVGDGGGFQAGEGCNLPKVKATDASPAVVDAKACAGDTVAPIRRKRCTACIKKGTHAFAVGGPDAGQCVLDPARFAAKYRLPPENWTTGFFTPASCTLHVTGDPAHGQCLDCTRRRGHVFASGECLKPEAAAKKAKKLKVIPPPAAVVAHPAGWTITNAVAQQETVGGAVVLRGGRFAGTAVQKVKIQPGTVYRLRAKIRGVGTSDNSAAGVELVYGVKNGQATAGWSATTPGRYTGSGGWKQYEEQVTGDVKTDASGGELRVWWKLAPSDQDASFVFEDVELATLDGKSVIVNGGFDAAGARVGIPGALAPLDPAITADLATIGAAVAKAPPPANLLPNGGFEETTKVGTALKATGWEDRHAITSEAARGGANGLDMSKPGTAIVKVPVVAGTSYQLSLWTRSTGASKASLSVSVFGLGKTYGKSIPADGTKQWKQETVRFTADASAKTLELRLDMREQPVGSFFVDDIELVPAS